MSELHTKRLVLRPFKAQDAPAIVAALNDKETCRGLTLVPFPYTTADADWFIAEASKDALAVCTADGVLVGACGLGAQLGYWIAKPQWGKGYAYEAAHAVLTEHFKRSAADVTSGYVDDNQASGAVLRKLGFEISHDKMLHIKSRQKEVPAKSVTLTKARWERVQ